MLQGFPDWFLFREFRIRSRSVNLPPPRSPSVPSSFIPPLPCSRACEPAIIAKGSSTSARPMLTQSHELCLCNCVSQHAVVGTFAQRLQGAPPQQHTRAHNRKHNRTIPCAEIPTWSVREEETAWPWNHERIVVGNDVGRQQSLAEIGRTLRAELMPDFPLSTSQSSKIHGVRTYHLANSTMIRRPDTVPRARHKMFAVLLCY